MKSFFLASFALIFSFHTSAKCMEVDKKNIRIQWTAFKTPSKVGVAGTLPAITLKGKNKGTSIRDVSYGMEAVIDTSKVATGNSSRDGKIAKFFFSTMTGGSKILAAVKKIEEKTLTLAVSMNGKTKDIPMSYTVLGNELKAKGVIDVFDWALQDELKAINKACYALHSGKTWNDVVLELTVQYKTCK